MTVAPARCSGSDMAAVCGSFSTTTSPGGDQGRQRPGVAEGGPVQRRQLLDPEHVTIARLALQVAMKALGHRL